MENSTILVGANGEAQQSLLLARMANRHGLITGATGTGKTVTLQVLAEGFSRLGVPVFTADVKGDLAGVAQPGTVSDKLLGRAKQVGLDQVQPAACPVLLWDTAGKSGHFVRATISEFGPLLLSSLLDLNETQSGLLQAAFSFADDEGLLLLDLKDLRALVNWMGENNKELQSKYGNIASSSVAALQRRLLVLEEAGGDVFFGEPSLKIEHLMQRDFSGRGVISVLDARTLIGNPKIYTTFLLWLLSELFEQLDEVGDKELPRLVFFFDEAHLLFDQAPKALLEKVENVCRLIRSKGVGVYFVTQNPRDVPGDILTQLGNRVQHALRGYTPKEQEAIRAAAQSFRPNPAFSAAEAIGNLGIGEALVSLLDENGAPGIVQRVTIAPPASRIGPLTEDERSAVVSRSPLKNIYDVALDRESAYEVLKKRQEETAADQPEEEKRRGKGSTRQGFGEAFFKSILRTFGNQIGRQIARGLLGSMRRR